MSNMSVTHSYEYNTICDVCGFKKKASELRKRWDGFMVCKEDWEARHPIDFYTTKNDAHLLPYTRPQPADTFVDVTFDPSTLTSIPTPVSGL